MQKANFFINACQNHGCASKLMHKASFLVGPNLYKMLNLGRHFPLKQHFLRILIFHNVNTDLTHLLIDEWVVQCRKFSHTHTTVSLRILSYRIWFGKKNESISYYYYYCILEVKANATAFFVSKFEALNRKIVNLYQTINQNFIRPDPSNLRTF